MENWKDIKGYEGLYQVSDLGRVRSLDRRVRSRFKTRIIKGRIMRINLDKNGYCYVSLIKDHKYKMKRVHQLVAESFLGHTACGHDKVVNHKDFNRNNNIVSNLEIVTQRRNADQKHLPSVSSHTGVTWNRKARKWYAQAHYCRKNVHLGSFDCELEASKAYVTFIDKIQKKC